MGGGGQAVINEAELKAKMGVFGINVDLLPGKRGRWGSPPVTKGASFREPLHSATPQTDITGLRLNSAAGN